MAAASLSGAQILFAFPRGEVMTLDVDLELLIMFADFLVTILAYIKSHNNKKN